jgi:Tfp pilus assembly protein PilF
MSSAPSAKSATSIFPISGNNDKAVTSYRRSLTLDPKDSTVQYNLGWALKRIDEIQGGYCSAKGGNVYQTRLRRCS